MLNQLSHSQGLPCFTHRNFNKGHGPRALLATVLCLLISSSSDHPDVSLWLCVSYMTPLSRAYESNKRSSTCISCLSHGRSWLAVLWTQRTDSFNNSLSISPTGFLALLKPCLIQRIWNLFQGQAKRCCWWSEWRDVGWQLMKEGGCFQLARWSLTHPFIMNQGSLGQSQGSGGSPCTLLTYFIISLLFSSRAGSTCSDPIYWLFLTGLVCFPGPAELAP